MKNAEFVYTISPCLGSRENLGKIIVSFNITRRLWLHYSLDSRITESVYILSRSIPWNPFNAPHIWTHPPYGLDSKTEHLITLLKIIGVIFVQASYFGLCISQSWLNMCHILHLKSTIHISLHVFYLCLSLTQVLKLLLAVCSRLMLWAGFVTQDVR